MVTEGKGLPAEAAVNVKPTLPPLWWVFGAGVKTPLGKPASPIGISGLNSWLSSHLLLPGNAQERQKVWSLTLHLGGVPGSQLWSDTAQALAGLWGMNQ